jgi:hypothetical protein
MTKAYAGVWRPLKVGHVFDWEHRVIHELQAVGSVILRPARRNARQTRTRQSWAGDKERGAAGGKVAG